MPALVNSSVGSLPGTSELEGTIDVALGAEEFQERAAHVRRAHVRRLAQGSVSPVGLGARGRADMIRRKATVLQKALPRLLGPAGGRLRTEPGAAYLRASARQSGPCASAASIRASGNTVPAQLRCDADRSLAAPGVVGDIVLRISRLIQRPARASSAMTARRRGPEPPRREPRAQLPAGEIAPRQQCHRTLRAAALGSPRCCAGRDLVRRRGIPAV